jgi:hypothetical protein
MNHGNGPGSSSNSTTAIWETCPPACVVVDHSLVVRRMHYALTGLYVVAVVVLQFLLFLRSFHVVFVLLVSAGFTYALAGLYIGIMISNADHLTSFSVGYGQARVIIWTSVVALLFVILAILQTFFLVTLAPLLASNILAVQTITLSNTTVDTVELILSHHIHAADQFVLFVMLLLFGILALLHIISIVVHVRIVLSNARIVGDSKRAYVPNLTPYSTHVDMDQSTSLPIPSSVQQQQQQQHYHQQLPPPLPPPQQQIHYATAPNYRGLFQENTMSNNGPLFGNNLNYNHDKRNSNSNNTSRSPKITNHPYAKGAYGKQ